MVQGIGQFRDAGFSDGADPRYPRVVVSSGNIPGLPPNPARAYITWDPSDLAFAVDQSGGIGNGYTVTRQAPGLWGLDYGTSSSDSRGKGRPASALARESRKQAGRDRARADRLRGINVVDTNQPQQERLPLRSQMLEQLISGQIDGPITLQDPALLGGRLNDYTLPERESEFAAALRSLSPQPAPADTPAGQMQARVDLDTRARNALNQVARDYNLPVGVVERLRDAINAAGGDLYDAGKFLPQQVEPAKPVRTVERVDELSSEPRVARNQLLVNEDTYPVWEQFVREMQPLPRYAGDMSAEEIAIQGGLTPGQEEFSKRVNLRAIEMADEYAAQGIPARAPDLVRTARRMVEAEMGLISPADSTGLPSDVPLWLRGNRGTAAAEDAALNTDSGGTSGVDPSTVSLGGRKGGDLNAYGTVTLPILGSDGKIAGYREVDPTRIAEIRTVNADAGPQDDGIKEITVGRLVQEAANAAKTPVITQFGLDAAIADGRFTPVGPQETGDPAVSGLLATREVVGPDQLLNSRSVQLRRADGQPIAVADAAAGLAAFAGRSADAGLGSLTSFDKDGRIVARFAPEVKDGVYTGNLQVLQPVRKIGTTATDRAIPYKQRSERATRDGVGLNEVPDVETVETDLYRIGNPMNRDQEQLRSLAAQIPELGVQGVYAPSDKRNRVVNIAALRNATEDRGYSLVDPRLASAQWEAIRSGQMDAPEAVRGAGNLQEAIRQARLAGGVIPGAVDLTEVQAALQEVRGQSGSQVSPARPFLDLVRPSGTVAQRLVFSKDLGGSYNGQLVPLERREVGPAAFVGGLDPEAMNADERGFATGSRKAAEAVVKAAAGGVPTSAVGGLEATATALGKGAWMQGPSSVDGIKQVIVPMLLRGELSPEQINALFPDGMPGAAQQGSLTANQVAEIFPAGSNARTMLRQAVKVGSKGQAGLNFLDEGPRYEMRRFDQSPNQWFQQGEVRPQIRSDRPAQERTPEMAASERTLAQQIFSPSAVRQLTVPGTEGPMPVAPNVLDEVDAYMASRPRQIRDRTSQPARQGELFAPAGQQVIAGLEDGAPMAVVRPRFQQEPVVPAAAQPPRQSALVGVPAADLLRLVRDGELIADYGNGVPVQARPVIQQQAAPAVAETVRQPSLLSSPLDDAVRVIREGMQPPAPRRMSPYYR